jgi:FMN phosphatase YigB (HAD superfamily)
VEEAMTSDTQKAREKLFKEFFENVQVNIGLEQQGHIPTVEKMLEDGMSWDEIGKAIGWHGPTANQWYIAHLRAQAQKDKAKIERLTKKADDRDKLMHALGWKVEATLDGVILDDASALRGEMVKARREAQSRGSYDEIAQCFWEEKSEWAVKLWRLARGANKRAETAEAEKLRRLVEAWQETNISFKSNLLDWYPKLHSALDELKEP